MFQQLSPALFGAVCIIYEISLICKPAPLDWLSWHASKALINYISAWLPGPTATLGLERAGGSAGPAASLIQCSGADCRPGTVQPRWEPRAGLELPLVPAWPCSAPAGPASLLIPHFSLLLLFPPPVSLQAWHCIFQTMIFRGTQACWITSAPAVGCERGGGKPEVPPCRGGEEKSHKKPGLAPMLGSFSPGPRRGQSGLFYTGFYQHAAGNYVSSLASWIKGIIQMHLQVN